jgi:arabinofuranosyltransferase
MEKHASVVSAPPRLWTTALVLATAVLCVLHVWVVDDAFITLRQVDQLVHGNGFVWNAGERVQAYTHPLWALLLVPAYALTHEGFWTLAVVGLVVTGTGLALALRHLSRNDEPWRAATFLLLLLPSKAFFDYTSSGLENCLTHTLLIAFHCVLFGRPRETASGDSRRLLWLCMLGGAVYLNRADTLLFVAPAMGVALWQARSLGRRLWVSLLPGAAPVLAWTLWSFVYYGSVVPNTAIAKIVGARLTTSELVTAGMMYCLDSLRRDPCTLLLAAIAVLCAWRRGDVRRRAMAAGMVAYVVYVVAVGAAGTHMSGRFFSGLACLAALTLADGEPGLRAATVRRLAIAVAAVSVLLPLSPVRGVFQMGAVPFALAPIDGIIDTRFEASAGGCGIFSWSRSESMPDNEWWRAGLAFRDAPARVHVGGPGCGDAIGMSGFAAGPDKFLIDRLGLSDALLARLPLRLDQRLRRPGHIERDLPAGYLASCENGTNELVDPDLHAYYDAVRTILREPVWSWHRLRTIVAMQLGEYDAHLEAYVVRHGLRPGR